MESRMTERPLLTMLLLLALLCASGSGEDNDRNFTFCGSWIHGKKNLTLTYDLSPGCGNITVSADHGLLSVEGRITARCQQSDTINLGRVPGTQATPFCLYWEPLLDQLWLEVAGKRYTLCRPSGLQAGCCTDLSNAPNRAEGVYGVANGTISGDMVGKTREAYTFFGDTINCKERFCEKASQGWSNINIIEETVMRSQAEGNVALPCALATMVQMDEDFQGYDVTIPAPDGVAPDGVAPESSVTVHLSSFLKPASNKTAKVVCTFFRNSSLFQEPNNDVVILDVVGITVENEVITNLLEPVRIGFHHRAIPETHSRKCVSWDTRIDPLKVNWKEDGCVTVPRGARDTECLSDHLTYFTILVQLEPRPVRHLMALTFITYFGNLISAISCVGLILFLCNKRRMKEQSNPIHLGLAVSLFVLNVLFFLTGTLANVGGEGLCRWVGAGLHYAMLSSFTWMGMEVFHTFWLVYMMFSPSPKVYVWNLTGFGLPAVPVIILLAVGNIYGVGTVLPSEDLTNPYLMCWMTSSPEAQLAHYLINISLVALLVSSGLVMLFLVYRKIRTRDEWRHNSVAFLSIWGLSCLFGIAWVLGLLDFGPLTDFVRFLSCILTSFQGFFLMVRFFMLGWVKRRAGDTAMASSSSSGSTRQQMLQNQEKH